VDSTISRRRSDSDTASELNLDAGAARSRSGSALRPLVAACLGLAALLCAFSASADEGDFARRGPYFGVGASRAMNTFEHTFDDAVPVAGVSVSDTWGLNARAGYQFARWFSTELEYEFLDGFGVRAAGVRVAELTTHAITVNAKFSIPAGRFQPYLLVGLGVIVPDIEDKSFVDFSADNAPAGRLGLGVDFYATRNVTLCLGFESIVNGARVKSRVSGISDESHGLNYVALQLGLAFHF